MVVSSYNFVPFPFSKSEINFILGPQVVLSVYKNMSLEGYGRCHIPLSPGAHSLNISLSKPLTSTFLGYIASFFGYQPELIQPKMLATTAGNQCKGYLSQLIYNIFLR